MSLFRKWLCCFSADSAVIPFPRHQTTEQGLLINRPINPIQHELSDKVLPNQYIVLPAITNSTNESEDNLSPKSTPLNDNIHPNDLQGRIEKAGHISLTNLFKGSGVPEQSTGLTAAESEGDPEKLKGPYFNLIEHKSGSYNEEDFDYSGSEGSARWFREHQYMEHTSNYRGQTQSGQLMGQDIPEYAKNSFDLAANFSVPGSSSAQNNMQVLQLLAAMQLLLNNNPQLAASAAAALSANNLIFNSANQRASNNSTRRNSLTNSSALSPPILSRPVTAGAANSAVTAINSTNSTGKRLGQKHQPIFLNKISATKGPGSNNNNNDQQLHSQNNSVEILSNSLENSTFLPGAINNFYDEFNSPSNPATNPSTSRTTPSTALAAVSTVIDLPDNSQQNKTFNVAMHLLRGTSKPKLAKKSSGRLNQGNSLGTGAISGFIGAGEESSGENTARPLTPVPQLEIKLSANEENQGNAGSNSPGRAEIGKSSYTSELFGGLVGHFNAQNPESEIDKAATSQDIMTFQQKLRQQLMAISGGPTPADSARGIRPNTGTSGPPGHIGTNSGANMPSESPAFTLILPEQLLLKGLAAISASSTDKAAVTLSSRAVSFEIRAYSPSSSISAPDFAAETHPFALNQVEIIEVSPENAPKQVPEGTRSGAAESFSGNHSISQEFRRCESPGAQIGSNLGGNEPSGRETQGGGVMTRSILGAVDSDNESDAYDVEVAAAFTANSISSNPSSPKIHAAQRFSAQNLPH
jgi:hypothetical protein